MIGDVPFNIENNEQTDNSIIFPPAIQRGSISRIPEGLDNATLEVVFKGRGGVFWQRDTKLSAAYVRNQIVILSLYDDTTTINATAANVRMEQLCTLSIQKTSVVINAKVVQVDSHVSDTFSIPSGVVVGACGSAQWNPLNGEIFAVRYYNRKLTQQEILYNQRVDNVRFNLGLNIESIEPYVPTRGGFEEDE